MWSKRLKMPGIPICPKTHSLMSVDHTGTAEEIGVLLRGLVRETVPETMQEVNVWPEFLLH